MTLRAVIARYDDDDDKPQRFVTPATATAFQAHSSSSTTVLETTGVFNTLAPTIPEMEKGDANGVACENKGVRALHGIKVRLAILSTVSTKNGLT